MKSKRGAGHIEFILSMVLFIGVVGFVLFFFRPGDSSRTIESSLAYGFDEVAKNSSVVLDSYSVKIEGVVLNDKILIELPNTAGKVSRVANEGGAVLKSEVASSGVNFEPNNMGGETFFIIKLSEDFIPSAKPTGNLGSATYEVSSSTSSNIVSEKRIKELNKSYEADYEEVKERFNLPGVEFSFSLVFADDDKIEGVKEIPSGLEVYSDSKRIEVLRENGKTKFADLVLRVW